MCARAHRCPSACARSDSPAVTLRRARLTPVRRHMPLPPSAVPGPSCASTIERLRSLSPVSRAAWLTAPLCVLSPCFVSSHPALLALRNKQPGAINESPGPCRTRPLPFLCSAALCFLSASLQAGDGRVSPGTYLQASTLSLARVIAPALRLVSRLCDGDAASLPDTSVFTLVLGLLTRDCPQPLRRQVRVRTWFTHSALPRVAMSLARGDSARGLVRACRESACIHPRRRSRSIAFLLSILTSPSPRRPREP